MKLQGQRVLVTGSDGFIGSHLTEYLVGLGCQVRALVYYNSFNSWGWLDHLPPEITRAIEVIAGDVRDPHAMESLVSGCDVVFHLAALIGIPYSYVAPDSYIDTNVRGTLNVLQASRRAGVAKMIHTSTSEVYGTAVRVPISEAHPLNAQSPYAASKIAADQLAASFYASFGTPVATIRPFNTYGPRQSCRAIIPTVISQIAGGRRIVEVGALSPTRDFSYVSDTVRGFVAVAAADDCGRVVNVGSNFEVSIGDTVKLIADIMNAEVEIHVDQSRLRPALSEVERLRADIAAARSLGWEPEYGGTEGLRRGLAKTIDWFSNKENLKLYKADRFNI